MFYKIDPRLAKTKKISKPSRDGKVSNETEAVAGRFVVVVVVSLKIGMKVVNE